MKGSKSLKLQVELDKALLRIQEIKAQQASNLGIAFDNIPKTADYKGSCVIVTLTALGGNHGQPSHGAHQLQMRTVHYIGFRGDEYLRARRIFGGPAFIHQVHDMRAQRDIGEEDLVVFANKETEDVIRPFNGNDINEEYL